MSDLARNILGEWDRLNADRANFLQHWQDVSNYVCPDRADYTVSRSPGQKRMQYIYDSTAIQSHEQLTSGLHSLLTSPTLQWFGLKAEDEAINKNTEARIWLDDASARTYALFNGSKHNFASQSSELYADLGSIGTSVMLVQESPRTDVLFSTKHMRECVIDESEEDRVDTLIRKWSWTAKQAWQAWGAECGPTVAKAAMDPAQEKKQFEFLHAVRPRLVRDAGRADARHKPFESAYVSVSDAAEISQGGFDEFPFMVPRFSKSTGEKYGRSPAMKVLPDIKTLNLMMKTVLMAAQKTVDPPMNVPDDGYLHPINTTPGARNFFRSGVRQMATPMQDGSDVRLGVEMINSLRAQVRSGFYADWMAMPSDPSDPAAAGKGVTATYTLQQRDEKMRLLSPLLARLQSEFLGPLIDRTFAIMWRRSKAMRFGPGAMLLPPPQILVGVPLRVEYVSPIAIAQKASQLDGVQRLVQTALTLGQIDPIAPRILDIEAILRLTGQDLNTPAVALKSPQVVQQEAQAAAEAQAQAQNHAALANVAGAAKDGTAALKNINDVVTTNQLGTAALNAPPTQQAA